MSKYLSILVVKGCAYEKETSVNPKIYSGFGIGWHRWDIHR